MTQVSSTCTRLTTRGMWLAVLTLIAVLVPRALSSDLGSKYDGTWHWNATVGWYCPEEACNGEEKQEVGACCGNGKKIE